MKPVPSTVTEPDRSFLQRLVDRVRVDERVATLFMGGSHASGTADEYSDLDLYLITTDEGFERFRTERRDLMAALGELVFLEEHEDFGFLLILYIYRDGVRGEMALAPARDIDDVHSGPFEVLVDRTGVMDGRDFRSGLDERTRAGIVRGALTWFWYERANLDVAIQRGHLWTAHYHLERCRERCLDLAWIRARPEVWPGGHEKAERILGAETLARLAPTIVPLQREALSRASHAVTDFYREVGPEVAVACGVEYPAELDETITEAGRSQRRP
jgi:predicted nucleotidyltransferase